MNKAEEKKHYGIRRKRTLTDDEPGKRGDDDDDDDEPDNKDERHHRAEHDQNAFVEHAFAAVVEYVGHFFAKLSKFLSSAFTGRDDDDGKHDAILTNASLETAGNIRTRLDVAYDEMQTEHVEMLETLWRSCFEEDGVTFPSSSTAASSSSSSSPRRQPRLGSASEKWKEMGWQGTHPSTDLRGCGVFALENLVYFAQTRKDSFKVLVEKKNGTRSDWEYPFAAAGVNVTHELTKLLDVDGIIRKGTVGETLRVDKCVVGFFELIRRHSGSIASGSRFDENGVGIVSVFHEIYCDAFEILDQEWLLAKATYMEFTKVLERTIQTRVKENLERLADEAHSVS